MISSCSLHFCTSASITGCSVCPGTPACIRQHTSAYASIRLHTSAYVSIRQHMPAYVSIRQQLALLYWVLSVPRNTCVHTSAYVSIRQHTPAYVSSLHFCTGCSVCPGTPACSEY